MNFDDVCPLKNTWSFIGNQTMSDSKYIRLGYPTLGCEPVPVYGLLGTRATQEEMSNEWTS